MEFYNTIGVSENASHEEIKRAYRTLTFKHHPDRNGNSKESNAIFQKINEAYLKITEMRQHQNQNQSRHHIEKKEINNGKPPIITINLNITMEQSYSGCMLPIEIERWVIEGNIKRNEKEKIYVNIPKGIDDNEIITYNNKGNINGNGVEGDVKIIVKMEPHMVFERQGLDIIYKKEITLKEALCGFEFQLNHLSGKKYNITNSGEDTIISPNYKRIMNGLGLERNEHKGNMIIVFDIIFPINMTKGNIDKLKLIL